MTEPSRARRWKYGLGLGVLVVGALLWFSLDADRRAQQRNREAIERLEPFFAKYRAALADRLDYPRPYDGLASGTDVEAWEHYEEAWDLVPDSLDESTDVNLEELVVAEDLSPEIEPLLLPWRAAIDALAAGARAERVGSPTAGEREVAVPFSACLAVTNAALLSARAHFQGDEFVEGVDQVLDVLTLAVDLMPRGELICEMVALKIIELTTVVLNEEVLVCLSVELQEKLASALACVDRSFLAYWESIASNMIWYVDALARLAQTEDEEIEAENLIPRMESQIEADEALAVAGSWTEVRRVLGALEETLASTPELRLFAVNWMKLADEKALTLTRLRMLRLALATHLGSSDTDLIDPFTGEAFVLVTEPPPGFTIFGGGSWHDLERRVQKQ